MGQIKRSVVIEASVDEVFGLMTDTQRFKDWAFGFTKLDQGPDQLTANSTFRWTMKGHGLTLRPRSRVTSFTAPETYQEELRIPGILRATVVKTVVQQKRRTQLSWVVDYRIVGGPLGVVVDWMLAHRVVDRAVLSSLEGAKRALETTRQPARGGYRRQTAVR